MLYISCILQLNMMSGSKAPDFDAYGLFRAMHSHNPGIKQYNALYAAAVKNGYSVTDEQVQAYIEDMKLQLESVDNSEDIQDVIDQFDSEDDYWAYEFAVYQKQLPIQNYVSALNDEYNEKAVDSSSEEAQEEWDTYFENLKDKLVKEQNFQNQ